MLDWDDLRFYRVAAQAGTVTAAAEKLRVSRTTVTRRVESLERSLGIALYERTAAGPGSTDAGRLVLACARDVESRIDELLNILSADAPEPALIRICVPVELGLDLVGLGADITRHGPGATFEFVQAARPDVELYERRSLIGLCIGDDLPPHMNGRVLSSLTQRVYRAATGDAPSNGAWRWIGWGRDLDHTASAQWIDGHVESGQMAMRVNSAIDLKEATRRGLGVGYLWDQFVDDPNLLPAEGAGPAFHSKLWLCMHEDVPPAPRVRAVLQCLGDYIRSIS